MELTIKQRIAYDYLIRLYFQSQDFSKVITRIREKKIAGR